MESISLLENILLILYIFSFLAVSNKDSLSSLFDKDFQLVHL